MNWLLYIVVLLAILKVADIIFALRRLILPKPKAIMCVLLDDDHSLSVIRQSVNRFLENKGSFSKLVFIADGMTESKLAYCSEQISNLRNVEILCNEGINERICRYFRDS